MEHRIRAHADGIVTDVRAAVGELVNESQALLDFEVSAEVSAS